MEELLERLNAPQRQAVMQTEGPLLLLAGAGSGKTRVITHRIAYLIDELGVNSYNILAITFTNKAAKEMRERVDALVGFGADAAWIMTFHACCVRILRRFIDRIGYDTNFTIYDTDDQKSVMKDILKRMSIDTKIYKEKMFLSKISAAKDNMQSPDDMYAAAGTRYEDIRVAEVYREYQEQLRKNNAVDFDDIINLTVELFNKDSEALNVFRERFKYIMVDEYQDTNTAQFQLIRLLASGHRNLCVVGDDDQSIYRFRGANIMNILNFEEYFPDATVIKLEQNYRSTQNILNAANSVVHNNTGRKDKKLWTEAEAGDKVAFNLYENGYSEATGIALDIEHNINQGYNYNDCAVLYRTNAQSRALEEKLLCNNIPYRIYGGINFYARREIKDILAYLKTIDNGRDDISVMRILNVPKRGIGAVTVDRISAYAYENDCTFFDALMRVEEIPTVSKASKKITPFVDMIRVFRSKAKELPVSKLIGDIVETIEYYDYLADNDTPEEVEERRSNIEELISKAVTYEESTDEPTLYGFLEEVALVADIDNMDSESNVVSLMTLHSAKGLEFPIVYIAGMEEGLFPSYMAISGGELEDIEEERRLCYVGITRAMKKLTLSAARMRMIRGENHMNKPSRFVKEIPDEYIIAGEENEGYRRKSSFDDSFTGFKKSPFTYTSYQKTTLSDTVFDKEKPAAPASMDELGYELGDRVNHIKFGDGTVTDIVYGGRDYEITVNFDKAGNKKMFASFAKLKRI